MTVLRALSFWSKVDTTGDCWQWTASLDTKGYGQYAAAGKLFRAHRLAYEALIGPIPGGLDLDHLCRNRSIAAARAAQTHCIRGHEFTPENTYVRKNSCRTCVACRRAAERRRRRVA